MSSSGSGRGRTFLLSLVVVLAVIVLALVGFLVFGQNSSSDSDSSTTSTTNTVSPKPTETDEPTTESSTPTRTTPTVAPGAVTYQLTGSGDVVALAFRTDSGREVVAATGAPWSNRTTVSDRRAEMTAMVVRGKVTCTILHGDKLISSSTSSGGALRCVGRLPR